MTHPAPEADRDEAILDAAARIFIRFGFRKASMDELARAAGLSRQGLYLHFSSKNALFRAAVGWVLERARADAAAALSAPGEPLEDRLVAAYDAAHGALMEDLGASGHMAELEAASARLVGDLFAEHEAAFVAAVARALEDAGVAARWAPAELTALDLARTLDATATGLKRRGGGRDDYRAGLRVAARITIRSPK